MENGNESSSVAPGAHNSKNRSECTPRDALMDWMDENNFDFYRAADILKVEPATIAGVINGASVRDVIHNKLAVHVPGIETIGETKCPLN